MKILMVISQFYPIVGGAERQAQVLSSKLKQKGIDIDIVTGWWRVNTPRKEVIDGIKVKRNFTCFGMFGIKGIRPFGGLLYMMSLGIYLLIHRKEYDLLHVHQALYPAFITTFVAKEIIQKPVIVKNGCSGSAGDIVNLKKYPFGRFQLHYLVKKIDRLIVVNHEGRDEFRAAGYPDSKIKYVPNGVLIPSVWKDSYEKIQCVVSAVRLDQQKGIDILLRAWKKVIQETKGLQLLILGKGPLEPELKALSITLGIGESTKFIGLVPNVEEYLKKADIFVLPSRAEGMSNALLEAMSIGLPCIATKISGNIELMGANFDQKVKEGDFLLGENGILANPDDVEGLAKAILFLIHNAKVRKEVGIHGRSHIQNHFSIDSIADRYVALYRSLLQES
jgi:glycosyltransferase involved in cell wall biosynthesis